MFIRVSDIVFCSRSTTCRTSTSHCLPGIRGELPPPGHDHDRGGGCEQPPGADEPAEIAERKEECALAAVEMLAGGFEQARGAYDMRFGFWRLLFRGRRPRHG